MMLLRSEIHLWLTLCLGWKAALSVHWMNHRLWRPSWIFFSFSFYNSDFWSPLCGSQLDSFILISFSIFSRCVRIVLCFIWSLINVLRSFSFICGLSVTCSMRPPPRWRFLMFWRLWCKLFRGKSVLSNPTQVFQAVHKGTLLCRWILLANTTLNLRMTLACKKHWFRGHRLC